MKSQHSLLFLPLLASFLLFNGISSAVGGGGQKGSLSGGWQQIKDVKDPHVIEIKKFAVTEYKKEAKRALEFKSVVKGETQVVAGTNYRLDIATKDGTVSENYEAVVWEKPWESFRNLTSFKRLS